ncbi:lipase family protein [Ferrimonas pelagia]|uniref:Fungal lipase-type domain-containing protein n=1 Tax=Ferrimonas pelagia TaxID=1177826 RepID=A0ABP9FF82_9GAMM
MGELSRLAYFKSEGSVELASLAQKLAQEHEPHSVESALTALMSERKMSSEQAREQMAHYLSIGEFRLHAVFNHEGSQALMCNSDALQMNVLAFRGTEMEMDDIKADLDAGMIQVGGYGIHRGFYHAFEALRQPIETQLLSMRQNGYPLYITGHSLGGALALLATKFLACDSIEACYTFGGPRVASLGFGETVRTPIYRVVNAAVLASRLPPAYLQDGLNALFKLVRIPYLSKMLVDLLESMVGFRHCGDMRYLTACQSDFADLHV